MRKVLDQSSDVWKRYDACPIKGNNLVKSIGKLEESEEVMIVWDILDVRIAPWKSGVMTIKGVKYCFCAHIELYMTNPNKLIMDYICKNDDIDHGQTALLLWKE